LFSLFSLSLFSLLSDRKKGNCPGLTYQPLLLEPKRAAGIPQKLITLQFADYPAFANGPHVWGAASILLLP
jgi:hypothetical protein